MVRTWVMSVWVTKRVGHGGEGGRGGEGRSFFRPILLLPQDR